MESKKTIKKDEEPEIDTHVFIETGFNQYVQPSFTTFRPRCECEKQKGKEYCDAAKFWFFFISQKFSLKFNNEEALKAYRALHKKELEGEQKKAYIVNIRQISVDLERTFPGHKLFRKGKVGRTGITQLNNLLCAIAKSNLEIGYVQGMNFIAGSLLYHTCEHIAFWLFKVLMTKYDLYLIYQKGMCGLFMHCKILDLLIAAKYESIWENWVTF